MHDLLEGVCQYNLSNILHHFIIDKGYFSVSNFNSVIKGFNYIYNDKQSVPAELTPNNFKTKKYMMSAAEMLVLTRNLTMIIGHLVPDESEFWRLIILLHQIIWCVTDKYHQFTTYQLLDTLISEYLTLLQGLIPQSFKPKHHFLIHYRRVMELVGPLWHIASISFERKHRSAKITAHVSLSRRNIIQTIALKEQLSLKYRLMNILNSINYIRLNIVNSKL